MIKPRVDKLLDQTDTHYAAVVVAAKRARQINAYYHSLSEGAYGEYTPPMVETESEKSSGTIAVPKDAKPGELWIDLKCTRRIGNTVSVGEVTIGFGVTPER